MGIKEFYIETTSFAAPFFSDQGYRYMMAETPAEALEKTALAYQHPAGLYAAAAYTSADAKNKGEKPLATWLCNHEIARAEITRDMPAHSYLGEAPGKFSIDGKPYVIDNPKGGRVMENTPC